ncbi:hypothetical protein J6590_003057 [Homalodisca vitripennis]|nr:hypothetical protein J6590_003057 [Homalodisca vitripennis]
MAGNKGTEFARLASPLYPIDETPIECEELIEKHAWMSCLLKKRPDQRSVHVSFDATSSALTRYLVITVTHAQFPKDST